NISTLLIDQNQLKYIDLSPLKDCPDLEILSVENNNLEAISLEFLSPSSQLWSLGLSGNPIKSIDITPLIQLRYFSQFSLDPGIKITSEVFHRDYSFKQNWLIYTYLPHIEWKLDEKEKQDPAIQSLYESYTGIMKHFRHDEFWADFRDRRLETPIADSPNLQFFDFALHTYLKIKDRPFTNISEEKKQNLREQIHDQTQDKVLPLPDLLPICRHYFEPENEPTLAVELFTADTEPDTEPELVIFHFWTGRGPSQLTLVQSFSWVKISLLSSQSSYTVVCGFNRGNMQAGQKFHPTPPPDEWPQDLFETTEVSYEIKTFQTVTAQEILTRSHQWLRQSYSPHLDPHKPNIPYRSDSLKFRF
ncbi:MAG: hypothetical protein ACXACP_00095, partial [Candidatus Hodarchaeales archaeon]